MTAIEAQVAAELGRALPPPAAPEPVVPRGSFAEIWRPPYLSRTIMMIIFNIFQTVGFYGFANWVPTLLIKQGIHATTSLDTRSSSRSQHRSVRCLATPSPTASSASGWWCGPPSASRCSV